MFLVPVILLFVRLDHGDHHELIADTVNGVNVAREYSHVFAHSLIFFVSWSTYMFYFALALMLAVSLWDIISPPYTTCSGSRQSGA